MLCWLLACHASRIAEGFAHVSQEQLQAGSGGAGGKQEGKAEHSQLW